VSRTRDQDACPGALQVHQAADGALVRVRLPGGFLTAAALETLAHLAADHGNGSLELTSRGSVQIRGVTDTARVADAVAAAGLLPSPEHERVRNIVASPLSGRSGGQADVRGWVGELDAALQADPGLVQLPGRFWFALDDGRGDVSGLRADLGVQVTAGGVALLLSGVDTGVRLPPERAVPTLVRIAARFQEIRGKRWRVIELDDPSELIEGLPVDVAAAQRLVVPDSTRGPVGWIPQTDGRITLGAGVPLGVLPARTAEFLAAIEAPVVVTPWRSVLVCDLAEEIADTALRVLAPLGLIFDENSPWLTISACAGTPAVRGPAPMCAPMRAGRALEQGRRRGRPHPLRGLRTRLRGTPGRSGAGGLPGRLPAPAPVGCASARIHPRCRQDLPGVVRDHPGRGGPGAVSRRHRPVVVRLIHTCGQVDVTEHVAYTPDVVTRAARALAAGPRCCAIRRWWPRASPAAGCPPTTRWSHSSPIRAPPRSPRSWAAPARRPGWTCGPTGSAGRCWPSAMRPPRCSGCSSCSTRAPPSRPRCSAARRVRRVAQSKDELIARPRGMSYLVVTGRRGGSAMAAAAVNAIASERE
jgi:precorrin-3B synthase